MADKGQDHTMVFNWCIVLSSCIRLGLLVQLLNDLHNGLFSLANVEPVQPFWLELRVLKRCTLLPLVRFYFHSFDLQVHLPPLLPIKLQNLNTACKLVIPLSVCGSSFNFGKYHSCCSSIVLSKERF